MRSSFGQYKIQYLMRFIDTCCSLPIRKVYNSIAKLFGISKKEKAYEGMNQFEQEEFQTGVISTSKQKIPQQVEYIKPAPENNQQDIITIQKKPEPPKEQSFFGKLQNQLLLPTNEKPEQKIPQSPPPKSIDLLNSNHLIEQIEIIKSPKKEQQRRPPVQSEKEIETTSFKISLEPGEKYFQILENKAKNLKEKFNQGASPIDIQRMSCELQIKHTQSEKLNIFIYSFRLPCTYSFYNSILNDYALQKKLDPNIDQFRMLELITNNARINYLSYKKVLIVSPRDFVYMKYSNSWENEYWDVSFSIPYEATANKVRGEIILSACKIIEKNEEIVVHVYSEVDMKLSVSPKITKNQAVNEIKKYVEKCEKYIKQNYRKELA